MNSCLQQVDAAKTALRSGAASKRKLVTEELEKRKSLRFSLPVSQDNGGRPAVPLDVIYLGLSRDLFDSQDFKRGKHFERLCEGSIRWSELNEHQQDCVYAKGALRGCRENEIVCSLCSSPFSKAQDFKQHIGAHFGQFDVSTGGGRTCPSQNLPDKTVTSTYEACCCPLCSKHLTSKQALTKHIRDDHKLFCKDLTSASNVPSQPPAPAEEKHTGNDEVPRTSKENTCAPKPVRISARKKTGASRSLGKETEKSRVVKRPQPSTTTPEESSRAKNHKENRLTGKTNTMEVTVVPKLTK